MANKRAGKNSFPFSPFFFAPPYFFVLATASAPPLFNFPYANFSNVGISNTKPQISHNFKSVSRSAKKIPL